MAFLINKYLPAWTYHEYHEKVVNASAKECFLAAKGLDMKPSFITRTLMKLRELPTTDLHFLEENLYEEFVIDASQHHSKIFWNFYFKEFGTNKTMVSTETRILCLTRKSKFLFSLYWFFVKQFSGITRLEMLRLIKKKAERS